MTEDNVRFMWVTDEEFLKVQASEAAKAVSEGRNIRAMMLITVIDDWVTCISNTHDRTAARLGYLEIAKSIVIEGNDNPNRPGEA